MHTNLDSLSIANIFLTFIFNKYTFRIFIVRYLYISGAYENSRDRSLILLDRNPTLKNTPCGPRDPLGHLNPIYTKQTPLFISFSFSVGPDANQKPKGLYKPNGPLYSFSFLYLLLCTRRDQASKTPNLIRDFYTRHGYIFASLN